MKYIKLIFAILLSFPSFSQEENILKVGVAGNLLPEDSVYEVRIRVIVQEGWHTFAHESKYKKPNIELCCFASTYEVIDKVREVGTMSRSADGNAIFKKQVTFVFNIPMKELAGKKTISGSIELEACKNDSDECTEPDKRKFKLVIPN